MDPADLVDQSHLADLEDHPQDLLDQLNLVDQMDPVDLVDLLDLVNHDQWRREVLSFRNLRINCDNAFYEASCYVHIVKLFHVK
jgi:hypothetical protein